MLDRLISDPRFYARSRNRWHELRPRFRRLDGCIAHCANLLKAQAERDQQLWNKREPARFDPSSTWAEAVRRLRTTYNRRLKALDAIFK